MQKSFEEHAGMDLGMAKSTRREVTHSCWTLNTTMSSGMTEVTTLLSAKARAQPGLVSRSGKGVGVPEVEISVSIYGEGPTHP
jgi:hypothetical protein